MAAYVFSGGGLVMFGFKFPASGSLPVILSSLVITRFIEIRRCPHKSRVEFSWPAIIKFFTFKVESIVFADIFEVSTHKKTTVLPYNRLCFQVQVLGALNQF